MSIVIFIIILAVLILAHESGHFLAAKKAGVRVDEFGLGFPPRLWAKKYGETEYSINLIPLGGFVKIYGEDPDEESIAGTDSKRSLTSKSKWIQAWVLFAGVFFNFLLAWLLISTGLTFGLPASESALPAGGTLKNAALTITEVLPNSPADKAGIKIGDRVMSLTDEKTSLTDLTSDGFRTFISGGGERELLLAVSRPDGEPTSTNTIFRIRPEAGVVAGGKPAIGVALDRVGTLRLPFYSAIWKGFFYTVSLAWATISAIYLMFAGAFRGDNSLLSSVTGPVGLVGLVGSMAGLGWAWVLNLTAVISINLAVLNLVPFPALDGGRLFFLLIEAIKGKRITPRVANLTNSVGFILLMVLMLVITYRDIVRLFVS